jgi:hypothetical protein
VWLDGRQSHGSAITPQDNISSQHNQNAIMSDRDSVASLDSTSVSGSTGSYDSDDEEYQLALKEWEESLEQLQQLVAVLLLPFLGKWLGRKWSYWGMNDYLVFVFSH